jgi:hypothetical protein
MNSGKNYKLVINEHTNMQREASWESWAIHHSRSFPERYMKTIHYRLGALFLLFTEKTPKICTCGSFHRGVVAYFGFAADIAESYSD